MFTFTNNRRFDLIYDAAGNVIADAQGSHVFDAAGQRVLATAGTVGGGETGHAEMAAEEQAVTYDGDGQPAKNTLITRSETLVGDGPQTFISDHTEITYYLRSTVLGGYVVGELNHLGQKSKQYVYAGGERLLEQSTVGGFNTINWQHRNPLSDSWISVDANGWFAFRTEVDAHGRETGIEAPTILPNEPSPPPQTRSPSYLEMQGGATIEAESGMQLYEDVFLNRFFEGGNGPGEGGYDWLRTLREFQLSLGVKFALGMSWLDLKNRENYEPVLDYVVPGREGNGNDRRVNHYRLKPGIQQRGNGGKSRKEEPQEPQVIPIGDLKARIQERLDYGACAEYVKKLISKVSEQNPSNPAAAEGILGLYDQIDSQANGGFVGTRHLVVVDPATGLRYPVSGSTKGSIASGNALVQISFVESYGPPNAFNLRHAAITYGVTGLHEIIHQSGSNGYYSDYQLAVAAKALNSNVPWSPLTDNSMMSVLRNSGYWDSELMKNCVPESNR